MKTRVIWGLLVVFALISIPGLYVASAQRGPWQGWYMGPGYWMPRHMGPGYWMPGYAPSTEVTVKGTVEEVRQIPCPYCPVTPEATRLIVKVGEDTLEVEVGPTAFLTEQKFSFQKGDAVEITGSRTTFGGAGVILAREVKKGDQTLTLRPSQGIPPWAGWHCPRFY